MGFTKNSSTCLSMNSGHIKFAQYILPEVFTLFQNQLDKHIPILTQPDIASRILHSQPDRALLENIIKFREILEHLKNLLLSQSICNKSGFSRHFLTAVLFLHLKCHRSPTSSPYLPISPVTLTSLHYLKYSPDPYVKTARHLVTFLPNMLRLPCK